MIYFPYPMQGDWTQAQYQFLQNLIGSLNLLSTELEKLKQGHQESVHE